MYRTIRLFHLLLAGCILSLPAVVFGNQDRMSVQVRSAPLRVTPSYLGAVTSELAYGDRVTVQEIQRAWRRVVHPDGRTGWLHDSALTRQRVVLQAADDAAVTASSQEVALAGKGFNQQVENEFKDRHSAIDFGWVDRMEAMGVSHDAITRFLADGSNDGGAQ